MRGASPFLAQRVHLPDEPECYRTDEHIARCLTLDHDPDFRLTVTTHHVTSVRSMKIGELAQRARVAIDTVRYYGRQGLLPVPTRRASGYRSYDATDVLRLRFVRRAKALGFTLVEIRDLLALSGRREDDMGNLKAVAAEKLSDIETKLIELTRIRDGLRTLVASCPGHGALEQCPILNALAEDHP